jgi:hypothetical protein
MMRCLIRCGVAIFIDPSTGEPHVYGHGVTEAEVEDVLARPIEDRPGTDLRA